MATSAFIQIMQSEFSVLPVLSQYLLFGYCLAKTAYI